MYSNSTITPVARRNTALFIGVVACIVLAWSFIASAQEDVPSNSEVTETEVPLAIEEESDSTPLEGAFIFNTGTEDEPMVVEEAEVASVPDSEPVDETVAPEPVIDQPVVDEPAPLEVVPEVPTPLLSTDKDDYHPGETATIFGRFFTPLTAFMVKVFGSDENDQNYTETETEVATDESGSFSLSYLLDLLYRPFYEVVVSTTDGEAVAETWFRDAAVPIYDQCSNDAGTGYTTGDNGCRWTTGAINGSNSVYQEGDATVQRVGLDGFVPGSTHSITLQYGTTKQGKHAYDFLTSWDHSENWITVDDRCQDITGCTAAPETSFPIPDDTNGSGQFQDTVGPRNFVMRGGTITAVSAPVKTGDYASDSETEITVTFTVDNSGPMCVTKKIQSQEETTCGAALWFGAHIARTAQWQPFNGTFGATAIPGSPYHVALLSLDGGSVGQRDNQMQASAIPATLIIRKDTVPDAAQDFNFTTTGNGLSSFSLDDDNDPTLSNTKTFTLSNGGNFTVTEALASGYVLTNLVCTDPTNNTSVNLGTRTATIALASSETVECVFTNTLQTGSITIVKNTVGGDDEFSFTSDIDGNFALNTTNNTASQVFSNVVADTYNVAETVPDGWVQTSATCSDGSPVNAIDLSPGEDVTCTFTNSKLPTLTINKIVTNDNGGTAVANDFQGKIDGNNVPWSVAQTVSVGAHTASETMVSTYTASDWGGDCAADGSVTLAAGENKTCTITNNDNAPKLTLNKILINDNGGTATEADWTLTATGPTNVSGPGAAGDADVASDATFSAGEYVLSESAGPAGYAASEWTCSNGDNDGTVTVELGDDITCTITNNDAAPSLTLVKQVVNDDGGTATEADWTLTATGPTSIEGAGGASSDASFDAGQYALSESTGPAGYTAGAWSCVGGTQNGASVTLGLGESATCTIINDDQPGTLKVTKVTDPVSDVTTEFDITASADGDGEVQDVATKTIVGGQTVAYTVDAGTYDVSEADEAGWVETENTCNDVVVPNGGEGSCTITNVQLATIIIEKDAINNNAQDFSFTNNFGEPHAANFLLDDDSNATLPKSRSFQVMPGTYAVSEAPVAGWQQESATCSDQSPVGAINVTAGETVTCTFVNEQYAKIILVKNTQGGDGDFDFDATGAGLPTDIDLTTVAGTASVTFNDLDQDNTYTIAETVPEGWDLTSATCTGTNAPNAITPDPGETVTCTFENIKRGSIAVIKETLPDGAPTSFTFAGDVAGSIADGGSLTSAVTPGQYSTAETVPVGWTLASIDCSDEDSVGSTETAATTYQVAAGEAVTCTYTNVKNPFITIGDTETNAVGDDHTFTITVGQMIGESFTPVADGTAVAVTFSPSATVDADTCATGTVDGVCTVTINATTPGVITASAAATVTIGGVEFELDTDGVGENSADAVKTYVDARIRIGEDGINSITDPHTFTVFVEEHDGTGWVPASGETVDFTFGTNTANAFFVGDVDACVTDVLGQCTVTVNANAVGTVTVHAATMVTVGGLVLPRETNGINGNSDDGVKTYVAGKIIIKKETIGGDGDFDFTASYDQDGFVLSDGELNDSGDLAFGTYTVTETGETGWDLTSATCDNGDEPDSITINAAETVTCTFTNTARGTIIVEKIAVGDQNQSFAFVADYDNDGFSLLGGQSNDSGFIVAGDYSVAETVPTGWDQTSAVCSDQSDPENISLQAGETVTCTFTNVQRGHLIVEKTTYPAADTTTFTIEASGSGVITGGGDGSVSDAVDEDYEVTPGTYSVTETVPDGWREVSNNCVAVVVAAGQTETCTIVNEKLAQLTIIKDAQPNDLMDFNFITTGTGLTDFSLDDDAGVAGGDAVLDNTVAFIDLVPGTFTVVEDVPNDYWTLERVTCVLSGTDTPFAGATPVVDGVSLNLTAGADVTCTFLNEKPSPTRTQGFWQTHYQYAEGVFTNQMGGVLIIGTTPVRTLDAFSELLGGFWANIAKKTTGKGKAAARTALDKARMQLVQQLLAAELNCAAFGCVSDVRDMLDDAHAAYSTNDIALILSFVSQVDAFNNSGDTMLIGPAGKADPKTAKSTAAITFWDKTVD